MTKTIKSDRFLKLVGKHREKKKVEKFRGTLGDYLKLVEGNSDLTKLAHKRLFDTITAHGITKLKGSDERCNKIIYTFYSFTCIFKVNFLVWKDP